MTQSELEREVARTTGETVATIRDLGFGLMEMPDREPLVIDWDEVYPTEMPRRAIKHAYIKRAV